MNSLSCAKKSCQKFKGRRFPFFFPADGLSTSGKSRSALRRETSSMVEEFHSNTRAIGRLLIVVARFVLVAAKGCDQRTANPIVHGLGRWIQAAPDLSSTIADSGFVSVRVSVRSDHHVGVPCDSFWLIVKSWFTSWLNTRVTLFIERFPDSQVIFK